MREGKVEEVEVEKKLKMDEASMKNRRKSVSKHVNSLIWF